MVSVAAIMSPVVHTATTSQRLSDVRDLMVRYGVHHVPIVDGRTLVGMISASDLLGLGFDLEADASTRWQRGLDAAHTVADVMAKHVSRIGGSQPVLKAAEMLCTGEFHALPVVGDDSRLVGIVTSTDLVRQLRDLLSPEPGASLTEPK